MGGLECSLSGLVGTRSVVARRIATLIARREGMGSPMRSVGGRGLAVWFGAYGCQRRWSAPDG